MCIAVVVVEAKCWHAKQKTCPETQAWCTCEDGEFSHESETTPPQCLPKSSPRIALRAATAKPFPSCTPAGQEVGIVVPHCHHGGSIAGRMQGCAEATDHQQIAEPWLSEKLVESRISSAVVWVFQHSLFYLVFLVTVTVSIAHELGMARNAASRVYIHTRVPLQKVGAAKTWTPCESRTI